MKHNLPKLDIGAKPGVRTDISVAAINRWSPEICASASGGAAVISILDPIGADFWGDGITARSVSRELRAFGDQPVTVNINSPGGDVFEGIGIYNVLREHPGNVVINILGLAASAASIIAMAGNEVRIGRAAFLMIHNSWVMAAGDKAALREVADWLEPFDNAMAGVYAARTGIDLSDLTGMMDRETWINGQSAVDQGFADTLLSADDVSITSDDPASARFVRAERKMDIIAAKAGMSKADARALMKDLKGGMSGAAPTGMFDAAEIEAGVNDILSELKSLRG